MRHRLRKLFAVGMLLAILGGLMAGSSSAANLTGGNTTYVVNGEEVMFPFDPIKLGNGLLLPVEVFQRFGVTVEGAATGRNVGLKKAGLQASVTLGSTTAQVNSRPFAVTVAPVRLNGRLFLPADLLREYGVEFQQDGNYLVFKDYTQGLADVAEMSESSFNLMTVGRSFTGSPRSDATVYLQADFLMLNEELLGASPFTVSYGTRARLANLLETNTLIYVTLSNQASRAGGLVTSGFFLVDDKRNQYDLVSVFDTGTGLLSAKLAPGATRTGVLVFPKVQANAGMLHLYYDSNGSTLGTFTKLK